MDTIKNQPTEEEVRAMRDKIYGENLPDNKWNEIKHNWLRPEEVKWLQEVIKKHETNNSP
jgi:hypothetical protein